MSELTQGRRLLRSRVPEKLSLWLSQRKPSSGTLVALLWDCLGAPPIADGHAVRGAWAEGAGLLWVHMDRTPTNRQRLQEMLRLLGQGSFWTSQATRSTEAALAEWVCHIPERKRACLLDQLLAAALRSGQGTLASALMKNLPQKQCLEESQAAAVTTDAQEAFHALLTSGQPLTAASALTLLARGKRSALWGWFVIQPSWPGKDQDLFEAVVAGSLVKTDTDTQRVWLSKAMAWGVPTEGWLEIKSEAWVHSLKPHHLPSRLRLNSLALLPNQDLGRPSVFQQEGPRQWAYMDWTLLWPSSLKLPPQLERKWAEANTHRPRQRL